MTPEEFLLTKPVFRSRDFAQATCTRLDSTARILRRYEARGVIHKITRGIWTNPKHFGYSIYSLVPYILDQEQGYISFLTALHRHEVISQIPQTIFVATTGHTRKLTSKTGVFSLIQLSPKYMRYGIEWFSSKSAQYGLATAEKALLDCLYISIRKGKRFSFFPELDMTHIEKKKFYDLLNKHTFPNWLEKKIQHKLEKLWKQNKYN